ncbi:MAG: hypothetical protein FWB88_01135 [Defluviitaleaceae bacterium]|nr:hypothetical protein [Defluviitaleaceae bacterium]MCL2238401.1 hypothetical protein [Defluviitaleaceae bacterium]
MWQKDAADKMSSLLSELLKIDKIIIGGSLNNPAELDKYSDVDMEVLLSDNAPINIKTVLSAISKNFTTIFGYEIISHSRKDAIRICCENGMRFDLIFRYPTDKKPKKEDDSFASKIDAVVNQFWFFASMILLKLGRKDNLIAAHLAFELCQLIIVIQMLQRDDAKGTNIHRFGDGEQVAVLHHSPKGFHHPILTCKTANEILSVLFSAAAHMDEILDTLNLGYDEKSDALNKMAENLLNG